MPRRGEIALVGGDLKSDDGGDLCIIASQTMAIVFVARCEKTRYLQ